MTKETPRRKQATRIDDMPVTRGSGNVYADLEFANPGGWRRHSLAMLIDEAIRERGLTQQAAAHFMGIDQPKGVLRLTWPSWGLFRNGFWIFSTRLGATSTLSCMPRRNRASAADSTSLRRGRASSLMRGASGAPSLLGYASPFTSARTVVRLRRKGYWPQS